MLKGTPDILSDPPRQEQRLVQEHTSDTTGNIVRAQALSPHPHFTHQKQRRHPLLRLEMFSLHKTRAQMVMCFTPLIGVPLTHLVHLAASEISTSTTRTTTGTESTSSDKLTALPGSIVPSIQTNRTQRQTIPSSSSAPSLHDQPIATAAMAMESHALPSMTNVAAGAPDTQGFTPSNKSKTSTPQRVSFEGAPRPYTTVNYTPRAHQPTPVHPLIQHQSAFAPTLRRGRAESSPISRAKRSSDPPKPSPSLVPTAIFTANPNTSPHKTNVDLPRSRASSRATSPIRLFPWPGFHRQQPSHPNYEDAELPFVPVDPFTRRSRRFSLLSPDLERALIDPSCEESLFCCLPAVSCNPKDRFRTFLNNLRFFFTDTVPRQMYLLLLLRLPSLYFSRIARLFEDAEVSQPDIEHMIRICARPLPRLRGNAPLSSPIPTTAHSHARSELFPEDWTPDNTSPALVRFKSSWEAFIDSLLREWKTFNLVSALLLSSVLIPFTSCNKLLILCTHIQCNFVYVSEPGDGQRSSRAHDGANLAHMCTHEFVLRVCIYRALWYYA